MIRCLRVKVDLTSLLVSRGPDNKHFHLQSHCRQIISVLFSVLGNLAVLYSLSSVTIFFRHHGDSSVLPQQIGIVAMVTCKPKPEHRLITIQPLFLRCHDVTIYDFNTHLLVCLIRNKYFVS